MKYRCPCPPRKLSSGPGAQMGTIHLVFCHPQILSLLLFILFSFLSAHVSSLISFCFFMTCSSLLILIIFQEFKMWTVSSRNFAKEMTSNAKCCNYVRACNILTLWGRIPWVYSSVGSHIS